MPAPAFTTPAELLHRCDRFRPDGLVAPALFLVFHRLPAILRPISPL